MTEQQEPAAHEFEDLESRLRALKPPNEHREIDTAHLLAKGRRQVVARDAVTFGFAHLLQTVLALFSALYTARNTARARRNEV